MNNKEIDTASFCYNLSKQAEDIKNSLILLGVPTVVACYFVIKFIKKYLLKEVIKNV